MPHLSQNKHKMPSGSCPVCEREIDRASGIDHEHRPKAGDCTICIYCASFLVINSDGSLREMTEAEVGELNCKNRRKLAFARVAIKILNK